MILDNQTGALQLFSDAQPPQAILSVIQNMLSNASNDNEKI